MRWFHDQRPPPSYDFAGAFGFVGAGLAAAFVGALEAAVLLLAPVPFCTLPFLPPAEVADDCLAVADAGFAVLFAEGVVFCFTWFSATFWTPCLARCMAIVERGRVMAVSTGVIGSDLRTSGAGFLIDGAEARMSRRLVSSWTSSIDFDILESSLRPAVGFLGPSGRGCFAIASCISLCV